MLIQKLGNDCGLVLYVGGATKLDHEPSVRAQSIVMRVPALTDQEPSAVPVIRNSVATHQDTEGSQPCEDKEKGRQYVWSVLCSGGHDLQPQHRLRDGSEVEEHGIG